jgi:DNA replication protein DnaC
VEALLRGSTIRPDECPTCGSRKTEVAPNTGVYDWPASTYCFDGKTRQCDCADQVLLYRHYLLARIPQEYMILSEQDWAGDPKALQAAVDYLEDWEGLRRFGMGIGFYSEEQGTGKTFLAMWIAKALLKQGESVYCTYFRDMVSVFELPIEERKEEEARLKDCNILVLDEIARPISNGQQGLFAEKFEALIRHRSNYNKVTILTTNLTPDELDDIYPRTYSLLRAKERSVEVEGKDARREKVWDLKKELVENGEARPII